MTSKIEINTISMHTWIYLTTLKEGRKNEIRYYGGGILGRFEA